MRLAALVVTALVALAAPAAARAQSDPRRLTAAKELAFDKKYAEARAAWQEIQASASGADADMAAYWVARCSESLGESERALREYGQFLDRKPQDGALAEEARTSRVGLAAKLVKAGQRQHLGVLTGALADSNKTVRYYAALQLAGLGKDVGAPALAVLKEIVAKEKDEDLVERARLGILKLDPKALASSRPAPPPSKDKATWIRVRVYERGSKQPEVSINLPLGLAELVFKSLPDSALRELRSEGIDADNFWNRLMQLGPSEILSVDSKDGSRVQIWLE